MSEIIQAPKQQYLLSDENLVYQDFVDKVKTHVCSEPRMQSEKNGYLNTPRFGSLSLFGRSMPMYAYDHPEIIAATTNTAFTDGQNIFFCVDFIKKILENEEAGFNGMLFLTLHEICHPFFLHNTRLLGYDSEFANAMQDFAINTRLLRDFVDPSTRGLASSLYPLPAALAIGCGFKDGDIEKYAHRSEEDIARSEWKEYQEKQQQMQQDLADFIKDLVGKLSSAKGQPSPGKGTPMPGGSPSSGEGSEPGDGEPSAGEGQGGDDAGMGHMHQVSAEELAAALKAAGLDNIIKVLDIPVDDNGKADPAKQERQAKIIEGRIQNAVSSMQNISQAMGNRTPGAHCNDYANEQLGKLSKPKITWKSKHKSMILGGGMRMAHSFEIPGIEYYIDPAHMGISSPLYLGAPIPARPSGFFVEILDTSGSMNNENLREAASEIMGTVSNNKSKAPDVILYQVDTVIRGEPMIITPSNVDALLKDNFNARGRHGTCLTTAINMAWNAKEVQKRIKAGQKCLGIMYFTDLGDKAPKREDLPANLPKNFVYFAVKGTYNDHFAKEVSDYATTVSIGEEMTLEIDAKSMDLQTNKKTEITRASPGM